MLPRPMSQLGRRKLARKKVTGGGREEVAPAVIRGTAGRRAVRGKRYAP